MSRTLRQWITIRRERNAVRRKLLAVLGYIVEQRPGAGLRDALMIAFRADFEAYRLRGKSITGAIWYKTEHGPWPRFPR